MTPAAARIGKQRCAQALALLDAPPPDAAELATIEHALAQPRQPRQTALPYREVASPGQPVPLGLAGVGLSGGQGDYAWQEIG
jgi:hypothetical protein